MPPLIAAVTSFSLLALVLLKSPKNFKRLMLCYLLASVGLWSLLTFGMRASPDVQHAFTWEKGIIVAGFAVFAFYYHFTLAYTNARVNRGIILAIYSLLAIVAALASTGLLVEGMRLESYGYATITRPISYPLLAAGPLLIVG